MDMHGVVDHGNGGRRSAGPRSNRGMHLVTDPTRWGAWAHRGHRLWVSMPEEFWLYEYKVLLCPQPCSHDWTACPYAHTGEGARRRDPRRFSYAAVSCPAYSVAPRCARGLKCRYAHGVFELWLHPDRFRTRMCEAGLRCARPICFFAHGAMELRGDDNIAAVALPPTPPRVLQRAAAPAEPAVVPAQSDLAEQVTMMERLSLCADAGASSSSSPATSAVATGLTLVTAPVGGELACTCCPSSAPDDVDEDSLYDDYPHLKLILDLLADD